MRIATAVYITFAVAITLDLSMPAAVSAQVPTVERQPRAGVPVREGTIQTAAPAAQPPGQPTTASAPDPAPATDPAPVSAAPPPSGVTPLPPAAAPPTTASSSAAATAKDSRGYAAAKVALTLEGVQIGWLKSAEGGTATADVTVEKAGPDLIAAKHIAGVKYEPITVETDLESKALTDWIAASWKGKAPRKSGSILEADYDYKTLGEREFSNAIVAETTMPTLDVSSKEPALITIQLAPEYTRLKAGSGAKAQGSFDPKTQKRWSAANFRFEMTGLDGSRVNRIDAFTIRQTAADNPIGESRNYDKEPGAIEFPNLKITLPAASAQTWVNWHEDFVVKGNSGAGQERSGAIVYFDPSLKNELGRVNLSNCGIFRLAPEKAQAGRESVRRMIAELYCERMELVAK